MAASSIVGPRERALLERLWRTSPLREELPNGVVLVMLPLPSNPAASVQVWVRTGSLHEGGMAGSGLSHYLEHLLFKGTQTRQGREISAAIQALGGSINAYTTFERTVYHADLPAGHAPAAVEVLADMVFHSTLPAEEVERERDVILREIDMGRDDPDQRLSEVLFATAFREHAYRYPIIGHRDLFRSVTREDLLAYYRQRYTPANMVVVVAGGVDPVRVRAAVLASFGGVTRRPVAPVLLPAEPVQLAPREVRLEDEVEVVRGVLAWKIPGFGHPDAPWLDLLAIVLGQGDSSPLWREVREEKRLVHTVDAHCWNPGETGLWMVSYTCDAGQQAAAEKAILEVMAAAVKKAPPVRHLKRALRQLVAGEVAGRKTASGMAARIGTAEAVAGDLGFPRAWFERLAAVRGADLLRAARTYLGGRARTTVSLAPRGVAQTDTPGAAAEERGGFEELRLANGVRLLHQAAADIPSVHVRVALRGGPLFEEAGRRGESALLATLLTKDTRRHSAADVASRVEEAGGAFYPFSGNNSIGLAVEVLPGDEALAVGLLSEALFEPAFLAATVDRERDAQAAEIREEDDDVVTEAQRRARELYFGDHPLGVGPAGTEAGLAAITPGTLRDLWKRLRVGSNVVVAVSGDYAPARLLPALKRLLARIPRGTLPATPAPRSAPASTGEHRLERRKEQAILVQCHPGPSLVDSDFWTGDVADELFSGMASRLFERVREEKGLAYFVRSGRITGVDTAVFSFIAGTRPGAEAEVFAEIDAEVARMASGGVGETELERCRTRLKAGKRMAQQVSGSRCLAAALNALHGRPVNDDADYDARIDAVTAADLASFARRRLGAGTRVRLTVGP
jgi:zinc protease